MSVVFLIVEADGQLIHGLINPFLPHNFMLPYRHVREMLIIVIWHSAT